MIGKEGPQTDDMNSVNQSAEIVKKKMEERTKNKDDCEYVGMRRQSPLQSSVRQRIRPSSSSSKAQKLEVSKML